MRIPLNWLREYVSLPSSIDLLTDKLTMAGHMLDKVENLKEETVIDLELRGNRADCYSVTGIGREVAALLGYHYQPPKLHKKLKKVNRLPNCRIKIETPYVKRVMALVIKNVQICPSPEWLKKRLLAYGIPSINNIVDLTNYVMLEIGEPMHAFDLDLVKPEVVIRMAGKNEKMTTFEGVQIITSVDDLVWTKQNALLSIAGAIGSKDYSILPTTKNILLEAANYDRANIRRTCQRHNLSTEAGLRHEKELDPNMVETGIYRFLQILKENKWGEIENSIFDYCPNPKKEATIFLSFGNLWKLGGTKIDKLTIKNILASLFMKIKRERDEGLLLSIPTFRTDIIEEEDLIEEVLRIYGYEKIPAKILALEVPPKITPPAIIQEINFQQALTSLGFDEVISSSFVSANNSWINILLKEKILAKKVTVTNPPSPDFQEMRMSLLPNLLDFVKKVKNERGEKAMFFEIGKIYYKKEKNYLEKRRVGLIYWEKNKSNFLEFKGFLEGLFKIMNLPNCIFEENHAFCSYGNQFKISIDKKGFALGGELKDNVFFAEIDLDAILGQEIPLTANLWPKYPPIIEDLSFDIPEKTSVGLIIKNIKTVSLLIRNVNLIDSYQQTRTLRITYQHSEKTLSDEEVKEIRQKIIARVFPKFQARVKKAA